MAMGVTGLMVMPLKAGVGVRINIGVPVPPPPAVIVQAPPPPVTVEMGVPDYYVWDGYEYVGVIGTQYYYLGPGGVWLTLDASHQAHWHDWEKAHADWRIHATANVSYRMDANGHYVAPKAGKDNDHGH